MKSIHSATAFVLLWLTSIGGRAALSIPGGDGSDGALNVTTSTMIDLGLAVTGAWDASNSANAGKGVYDLAKWAVVFKYSSVNIAAGATVTFKNHPTHAPVVWLVSGNVTNGGTLNLSGANGGAGTAGPPEGGPGGFRGGARDQPGLSFSGGFGPGGTNSDDGEYGSGQSRSYGNAELVPLIGGSGGGSLGYGLSGGGGGGAVLIAASGTIFLTGTNAINASGGVRAVGFGGAGSTSGSGGAIRLVADQILGTGRIDATGGNAGRIRLEANVVSQLLNVSPSTPAVSPDPVVLWPPANAPTVRVVSVSGQTASSDPRAILENNPADVTMASATPVTILLETQNFPTNGTVNVFVKPRHGSQSNYVAAFVSGTTNFATWQVQRGILSGYSAVQARAVAP